MKAILIQRGREPLVVPEILGIATEDMDTTLCTLNYVPDFIFLDTAIKDYKDNDILEMWLNYFEDLVEDVQCNYDTLRDGIFILPPMGV